MMKHYFTSIMLLIALSLGMANAQTDLFISEYVEGWSNNKALEIYNPTNAAIELSNYRITRYSNGSNIPPADNQWIAELPSMSLQPYKSYVIVLDKRDPNGSGQEAPVWEQLAQRADAFLCPDYGVSNALYFNGDDAVALEKLDGTIVDLFARYGAPRPAEAQLPESTRTARAWTNVSPHFSGEGVAVTADHTLVRKSTVKSGVTSNPGIFNPLEEYDSLSANTFINLGWHTMDGAPANSTPVLDGDYSYEISSDLTNGSTITTLTATDAENDPLSYYMDGGNFVYISDVRYEPFALNKETGELTLVDSNGLNPTEKETFTLEIHVTDGYSQTDTKMVSITVKNNTAIQALRAISNVNIYPNPAIGNTVEINSNKGIERVTLINALGQVALSNNYQAGKKIRFSYAEKVSGLYLVKVAFTDGTSEIKKLKIN